MELVDQVIKNLYQFFNDQVELYMINVINTDSNESPTKRQNSMDRSRTNSRGKSTIDQLQRQTMKITEQESFI